VLRSDKGKKIEEGGKKAGRSGETEKKRRRRYKKDRGQKVCSKKGGGRGGGEGSISGRCTMGGRGGIWKEGGKGKEEEKLMTDSRKSVGSSIYINELTWTTG